MQGRAGHGEGEGGRGGQYRRQGRWQLGHLYSQMIAVCLRHSACWLKVWIRMLAGLAATVACKWQRCLRLCERLTLVRIRVGGTLWGTVCGWLGRMSVRKGRKLRGLI